MPVLALLKMAAYCDRPYERDKDLVDLAHILREYPPNDDDRFFEDAIFDARLTEDQARGTILGRELGARVSPDDQAVVEAFVAMMASESPHWSRFVSASPGRDEDRLRVGFDAFRAAFSRSGRLNQSLYNLLQRRLITLDDAMATSGDAVELQSMLDGRAPSAPNPNATAARSGRG